MSELINEVDSKVAAAALPSTKKNPTEFLKQVLSNYYRLLSKFAIIVPFYH